MASPHAWYGCRRDLRDARDEPFAHEHMMAVRAVAVPVAIDLRQWLPPVMDQGAIGSCTAHGVSAAARYHIIRRNTTYDFEMSRLQLYYDSREIEGAADSDAGAEIRDVIKTLAKKGVGHEEAWPYNMTKFADRPPQEVYDDAVQYKALKYARVAVDTNMVKKTLAAGTPVIIGISLYASFESEEIAKTGIVPMPAPHEGMVGGHCMLIAGYGQKPGHFTVRNSWGTDWGDKGNCYIPEAYIGSSTYGSDYWALTTFGSDAELAAGRA